MGKPLDLAPPFFPVNPAPSSYAVITAARLGGGDLAGLVQAFPRAVWAEGRNVAEDEVIKEILAKYGFDPAISDRYMLQAADSYARNLDEAVQRGVGLVADLTEVLRGGRQQIAARRKAE